MVQINDDINSGEGPQLGVVQSCLSGGREIGENGKKQDIEIYLGRQLAVVDFFNTNRMKGPK